jgi:hypothetical protein
MRDNFPPDRDGLPDPGAVGVGVTVLIAVMTVGFLLGFIVAGCTPASADEPEITRSGYGFGISLAEERKLQAIHVSVEMQRELREVNLRRADQLVDCMEEARTPEQLGDCTGIRHEHAPDPQITEEVDK